VKHTRPGSLRDLEIIKNSMKLLTQKIDLHVKFIFALVFITFALRIWGIWNATSTDEYNEVFEALRVCSGHLNLERWFKRFYLYVLSVEYGVYYGVGWILNMFQSPDDFAIKVLRNMEPLFILGRITSALLGTGSVIMTYLAGKVLFNRTTGLLAALFLCLNVVNIELSHYARVDASLCFLTMTTFYFIAQIYSKQNKAKVIWYVLAGTFLGCAFQNKPQAVILIFPFAYAHLCRYKFNEVLKGMLEKKIAYFFLGGVLGFVIGNPAVLLAPMKFINSLLGLGQVYTSPINESRSEIGFIMYLRYFYKELGLLMSLVAGFCAMRSFSPVRRETILLISFMLPFYLLMGASRYMVSFSYMIPFMPFLYLLIANCLQRYLVGRIAEQWLSITIVVISGCLLIHPVVNVIKFERSISGVNTRILAKNWIEKNIPFGSKILMDSGKNINSSSPLIALNKKAIDRILTKKNENLMERSEKNGTGMVDEKSLIYFEMLRKTVPKESYDITSTGFGLYVYSLDYYITEKFQYLIISNSMRKARTDPYFSQKRPKIAAFYLSLDNDPRVHFVQKIKPTSTNSGDTFSIYKLRY